MIEIYVDGDACPVKDEIVRVSARYDLMVYMVSNGGIRIDYALKVKNIVVGPGFDEADNWIANHIQPGDIAITSDIQLAARCLRAGAAALGPTGNMFSVENIGSALAMRELNQYLREAGEIKGHNAAFTKADRSQFLQSLDLVIQRAMRAHKH